MALGSCANDGTTLDPKPGCEFATNNDPSVVSVYAIDNA